MADDLFKLENTKKACEGANRSSDRQWEKFHSLQEANSQDTEASEKHFQSGVFIGSQLYLINMQKNYIEALEEALEQKNADIREIINIMSGYVRPGISILTGIRNLIKMAYPDKDDE